MQTRIPYTPFVSLLSGFHHRVKLAVVKLPAEHATSRRSTSTSSHSIALHLLANLNVHVHVFADAPVEADALALVQISFPIVFGQALGRAGARKSEDSVSQIPHISRATKVSC